MRRRPLLSLLSALALGAGLLTAVSASAAPGFAPASAAKIRPGAQMITAGAQCTANFLFRDRDGNVLLGYAAHCAGTGGATATNGCRTPSRPLGTPVTIRGAGRPGTLVYSSWLAMQKAGERDANACAYNDFALVRLHPDDVARSNPTVPVFGGPTGLDRDGTRAGATVVSYGSSSLRLGLTATSPKRGVSLGSSAGRWTHTVYTATPGIPGDSGSGLLDAQGRAFGTLSTVALAPFAGSNGVGDLDRETSYARTHGMPNLTLVLGTERFRGVLAR